MKLLIFIMLTNMIPKFSVCEEDLDGNKWPTIAVSVLIRNKEFVLPYFLSCLNRLDYPKDRMYIWIYSDFNEDRSIEIIDSWAEHYASLYNDVYIMTNASTKNHIDEESATHWSPKRFSHVIQLRERAISFARKHWADYIFMVDADVLLTNSFVLKTLVKKNMIVVAPILVSDGLFSNFWCGMTEGYYYKRTDDYKLILNREKIGCFAVPMVNTAVLMSLRSRKSDLLTYDPSMIENYDGPEDDIIAFAYSAKVNDITLNVCNEDLYGFVPVPLEEDADLQQDYHQILNVKLEALSKGILLPLDSNLAKYVTLPKLWKYGFDEIYMINLERRSERRKIMELSFQALGMDVKLFKAIDGRDLDLENLNKVSVTLMPKYEDPYHKRPMKAGEIGCFLSHYSIWKEMVHKGYSTVLIFEDDIHFVPYFRDKLLELMKEIQSLEWDLVYIGRKILQDSQEEYVTPHTTRPLYSYWTLGYLITERGARKLLNAEPLSKMLPVDEFLPIMFDQHPNKTWKSYFVNRNLNALSAAPLLIHPTYYTGQEGYISDTEDSSVVSFNPKRKNTEL